MAHDRHIKLLQSGIAQAELEMRDARGRDEFIFAAGQYSAMSAVYLMIINNVNSEMAAMVVNDKIKQITNLKYGN